MNGAVEAANKNIKKIIAKATKTYRDWHEKLLFALHAYRTGVRTSTGATPYSLVYGIEAVLPIGVEISSLRVLREVELEEAKWVQARYEQLNFIEEKRMKAIFHGQLYQKKMMKAHDKKIRVQVVLRRRTSAQTDSPISTRPPWKMVTQLRSALCCEKSILRRSIDTHQNGWGRVPRSYQRRHSKEVLCLR